MHLSKSSPDIESRIKTLEFQIEKLMEAVTQTKQIAADCLRLLGPCGIPMPNERMLVQTLHGVKFIIDPHDLIMAPQLIVYREWESDLSRLVIGICNPDTIFVDVGANFGYFTCLAGSRIGVSGRGKAIAVEPNPDLVELLRINTTINWSMCPITILDCAAGRENGQAILSVPKNRAANTSLSVSENEEENLAVNIKTLDSLVLPGTAVDILKIDVEGHEAGVLRGASRVLSESPNILMIMEWSRNQMMTAGYQVIDLLNLFEELKIEPYTVPQSGLLIDSRRLLKEELLNVPYMNVLLRRL